MLGQRRRRWANIKTTLFQRLVFVNPSIWRGAMGSGFTAGSGVACKGQ